MRARCAGLLLVLVTGVPPVSGQQVRHFRTAAAIDPDTVRVGEPFTLGLSVAAARDADVVFPPLLRLEGELEQLRPPRVNWESAGGGSWRAHYRLTAWKAGRWRVAAVEVQANGEAADVRVPSIEVTSVLPAAEQGPLPLEPPRGPWPVGAFPWWLLLLLLALAVLWWLLRRLRGGEEKQAVEQVDAATAARAAFHALKERLDRGDLDLAAYYDGLEETLRHYLAATRGWPEERPVRDFVQTRAVSEAARELRTGLLMLRDRAGLVRFAHVSADAPAALQDADTCLAWVAADEEAA